MASLMGTVLNALSRVSACVVMKFCTEGSVRISMRSVAPFSLWSVRIMLSKSFVSFSVSFCERLLLGLLAAAWNLLSVWRIWAYRLCSPA